MVLVNVPLEKAYDKIQRNWVVYRVGADRHSHVGSKDGADALIYMIRNNIKPKDKYMRKAVQRLLTEDEWLEHFRGKDKYINRPKHLRK